MKGNGENRSGKKMHPTGCLFLHEKRIQDVHTDAQGRDVKSNRHWLMSAVRRQTAA